MLRTLFLATLVVLSSGASVGQALSTLHIKVVLLDADSKPTPVPRHVLLVSDNPSSAPPRQIVTALDGTADVRLRPGNYTVESDRPVAFQGKAYEWTIRVDVAAGDTVLELTSANAELASLSSAATASELTPEADPAFLLPQWQDSVVALWTPTTHASGFVIDARGLIATNQRLIGTATSVEVQITPAIKVWGRVLAADAARDVAVLWIDPRVVASVRPVPLGCALPSKPVVANGQELFTIGVPLRDPKDMTSGTVGRVEEHAIASDFRLATGSAGGPVFTAAGGFVGITSVADEKDQGRRASVRVVRVDDACEVVASAEKKMKGAAPPGDSHLPVEPLRPFPVKTLEDEAKRRAGNASAYGISTADFDVTFITPVLAYSARSQSDRTRGGERSGISPLSDFSNWSEYVADAPPVLVVRVTPKFVEGFWTTVARGAARTQGVDLPPIKRFKSGFLRMRAFCGDAEVTPIHPFTLEQRVSETDAIHEGLYVFDPGAFGPHCKTARLVIHSEKAPEKSDTRVVDPAVLQLIWQDFAAYRALP